MSEVILPAIKFEVTKVNDPVNYSYIFKFKIDSHALAGAIYDKMTGFDNQVMLKISKPHKPRTTGLRSQSSHFHGHCSDIAAQTLGKFNAAEVKRIMKGLSMAEGWPAKTVTFKGRTIRIPESEANASTIDEKLLIDITHQFADEHNFWLTEYDDSQKPPVPYKTIGGRTKQQMVTYREQYPGALK